MPIKRSIVGLDLDLGVDSGPFKDFYATFQKYQSAVMKLPAAWRESSKEAGVTKRDLADMTAALMSQAELFHKMRMESEGFRRSTEGSHRAMGNLARSTREVAGSLLSATANLAKWTGLTTIATGLLGGGGLWGLDWLARTAGGIRQTTMGLSPGTLPSEQQGFTAFGRITNPTAFLQMMTHMQQSAEGKAGLLNLGVTPGMWRGSSAAVGLQAFRGLQGIVNRPGFNPEYLEDILGGMGLQNLIPEARILLNMSRQERQALERIYERAEKQSTGLNAPGVLLAWANLSTTLDLAEQKIRNTFITALAPLAPEIEKLSVAFSDVVKAFLEGPSAGKLIHDMTGALERFAKYVGTEQFATDVSNFVTGIASMALSIAQFVEWWGANKVKLGIVGGAYGGAYTGAVVGGAIGGAPGAAVGAAIGGVTGAVAGGTAMSGGDAAWNEALRIWERNHSLGLDKRSFSQFREDFLKANPAVTAPAASAPIPSAGGAPGPQGAIPLGGIGTGAGHTASQAERIAYAREYAVSKGLNPDAIVATMAGEGLGRYVGDYGTSFGDFQLHVGGGMGDQAVRAGINIQDPSTWQAQTRFAIDRMAEHRGDASWYAGQWHGAPAWAAASFSNQTSASRIGHFTGSPYSAIGAPGVKVNSRGQPYAASLETMPDWQKHNVATVMASIKHGDPELMKKWNPELYHKMYGGTDNASITTGHTKSIGDMIVNSMRNALSSAGTTLGIVAPSGINVEITRQAGGNPIISNAATAQ